MPEDERPQAARALDALSRGTVEIEGRMPWSSNATFLVKVCLDDELSQAVYKPHRGEQWLWDFPDGLFVREVAAYELSEALGWGIVPETILRHDLPAGLGSLQRFVPADFDEHYFTLLDDEEHAAALRQIATFDLLANNADRKAGHCLLGDDGRVWAIDHGLCFHEEPKLRTVMWDFGGEAIPSELVADVAKLSLQELPGALTQLLSDRELVALRRRMEAVVRTGEFPYPATRRSYPWPMI